MFIYPFSFFSFIFWSGNNKLSWRAQIKKKTIFPTKKPIENQLIFSAARKNEKLMMTRVETGRVATLAPDPAHISSNGQSMALCQKGEEHFAIKNKNVLFLFFFFSGKPGTSP